MSATPRPLFCRLVGPLASAALAMGLMGCAPASDGDVISLSLSSPDPLDPEVGEQVRLVVRAVRDDGSSTDVTGEAICQLSSESAPGRLDGAVFIAEQPGTVDIACEYREARGTLGVTVRGFRNTPIALVQQGDIAEGTQVQIEAIVFGIDPAGDFTDFWAQDEGGGEYSGIHFRDGRQLTDEEIGVSPVAVGDAVTVRGVYLERNGRSTIEYTEVTVLGSGQLTIDVVAIGDLDAAVHDGCLVALESVTVADPAVDDFTWSVTDGSATALVETFLYNAPRAAGDPIETLAGPLWLWTTDAGELLSAIVPRDAADVVNLSVGQSVAQIQAGDIAEDTVVSLRGLVVTHVDPFESPDEPGVTLYDLYAQDAGGGPGTAIVLRDFRAEPAAVAEGDRVDIVGVFIVSNGRKVVDYESLTPSGTATPAVDVLDVAVADLRRYESSLVRIPDLLASDPDFSDFTWLAVDGRDGGTATVEIDTLFYDQRPGADDKFSAITGVVFCDEVGCTLAPRRADDIDGPL